MQNFLLPLAWQQMVKVNSLSSTTRKMGRSRGRPRLPLMVLQFSLDLLTLPRLISLDVFKRFSNMAIRPVNASYSYSIGGTSRTRMRNSEAQKIKPEKGATHIFNAAVALTSLNANPADPISRTLILAKIISLANIISKEKNEINRSTLKFRQTYGRLPSAAKSLLSKFAKTITPRMLSEHPVFAKDGRQHAFTASSTNVYLGNISSTGPEILCMTGTISYSGETRSSPSVISSAYRDFWSLARRKASLTGEYSSKRAIALSGFRHRRAPNKPPGLLIRTERRYLVDKIIKKSINLIQVQEENHAASPALTHSQVLSWPFLGLTGQIWIRFSVGRSKLQLLPTTGRFAMATIIINTFEKFRTPILYPIQVKPKILESGFQQTRFQNVLLEHNLESSFKPKDKPSSLGRIFAEPNERRSVRTGAFNLVPFTKSLLWSQSWRSTGLFSQLTRILSQSLPMSSFKYGPQLIFLLSTLPRDHGSHLRITSAKSADSVGELVRADSFEHRYLDLQTNAKKQSILQRKRRVNGGSNNPPIAVYSSTLFHEIFHQVANPALTKIVTESLKEHVAFNRLTASRIVDFQYLTMIQLRLDVATPIINAMLPYAKRQAFRNPAVIASRQSESLSTSTIEVSSPLKENTDRKEAFSRPIMGSLREKMKERPPFDSAHILAKSRLTKMLPLRNSYLMDMNSRRYFIRTELHLRDGRGKRIMKNSREWWNLRDHASPYSRNQDRSVVRASERKISRILESKRLLYRTDGILSSAYSTERSVPLSFDSIFSWRGKESDVSVPVLEKIPTTILKAELEKMIFDVIKILGWGN